MIPDEAERIFHENQTPEHIARIEQVFWDRYGEAMRDHTNRNTPVIQRAVRTAAWQAVIDAVRAEIDMVDYQDNRY